MIIFLNLLLIFLLILIIDKKNPLSLINIVSIYYLFFIIRYNQLYYSGELVKFGYTSSSVLVFISTFILLKLSYNIFIKVKSVKLRDLIIFEYSYANIIKITSYIFICIGIVAWVKALNTVGGNIFEILSGKGDRYLSELGTLHDTLMHFSTAGIIGLATISKNKKEFVKIFLISSPIIIMALILARRSLIIPIILLPILIFIVRENIKIKFSRIVILVVVFFILSVGQKTVRYYYSYEWLNIDGGLTKSLNTALIDHATEVDPLIYSYDRFNIYSQKEWAAKSWYSWIEQLIPRQLVGEAKANYYPVGKYVAKEFYGSSNMSHGRPITMFGTLYLTYGLASLIFGCILLGYVFARIDKMRNYHISTVNSLLYACLWTFFAVYFIRLGDLTTAIIQTSIMFIPIMLFFIIIYIASTTKEYLIRLN